jgi:excisionase family DNA binding protein
MKAYYTVKEIADEMAVSEQSVRNWIRSGHLFAYHGPGRVNRIPLGSLMRLLGESQPVIHGVLTDERAAEVWHEIEDEHRRPG